MNEGNMPRRYSAKQLIRAVHVLICLLGLLFGVRSHALANGPESLFGLTNVIDVHMEFTAEEWEKLQPLPSAKTDFVSLFIALEDMTQDAADGKHFWGENANRPGLAGYLGVDHQYGMANVQIDDDHVDGVGIRYKGNGSFIQGFNENKSSFKIDFNEYNDDLEFRGLTKINLNNCITDPSMLREALSYELFREAGIPCSRIGFARVRLSVDGKYEDKNLGLFTTVEQVDKRFLKDRYGSSKGLLLKPSTFGTFRYFGEDWDDYVKPYVPKSKPTEEQKRRVIDFARLLNEGEDDAFDAGVEEYLDVDQFIRFVAVNVLLSNLDSFLGGTQNHYVYLEPESNKFQFLPWDMDHSFGAFILEGSPWDRQRLSINNPGGPRNLLIERVLKIDRFKELYHRYLAEYLDTIFAEEKMHSQISGAAEFVRPLVELNGASAKARFESIVRDGAANGTEQQPMQAFVSNRIKSVRDQLENQSEGYVPFNTEMQVLPVRKMIGFGIATLILVLLHFAGWIWGIVAGFRGTAAWGVLNLFFYPITPMIYGFFIRRELGLRAAIYAITCVMLVILVIVAAAVTFG